MPAGNPLLSKLPRVLRRALLLIAAMAITCATGGAVASELLPAGLQKVLLPGPQQPGAARYAHSLAGPGGLSHISASFRNLAGESVSLRFALDASAGRSSMRAFGVAQRELDTLTQACQDSKGCDQQELDRRIHDYYRAHTLHLREVPGQRSRLSVDIPQVVIRNQRHVQAVAEALRELADANGRDADWGFDTAISLVQAGLAYRSPAQVEDGRLTLGFYTPPRALERGYGDCDTKAALLASILLNLGSPRLIGVRVPNHYLLGVARMPRAGEAFVEHQGEPYVLVEAAGPAPRRPGSVARRTQEALERGEPIRIDPMF